MGGKINVQSQYGEGSLFMIQLPQKISKYTKPISEKDLLDTNQLDILYKQQSINYEGKKILLVDDNKLNIKVARKALNDFEFNIEEAYDGQQAIDKVKESNDYDLILMDIMMPNMGGEAAMKELMKMDNFNTPVIALTADAVAGAQERYINAGFTDYIAKPFSRDQIKEKLDSIFSNNSIVDENRFKDAPTYMVDTDSIDDILNIK